MRTPPIVIVATLIIMLLSWVDGVQAAESRDGAAQLAADDNPPPIPPEPADDDGAPPLPPDPDDDDAENGDADDDGVYQPLPAPPEDVPDEDEDAGAAAPLPALPEPSVAPASKRPPLERKAAVDDLQALPELKEALKRARASALTLHQEGIALFNKQRYAEAADKFVQAQDYDRNPELQLWEGSARLRANDAARSKAAYSAVLRNPLSTDDHRNRAIAALETLLNRALSAQAKADFVNGLGEDVSGVAIGKLFGEAFNKDPKLGYALKSAEAYVKAGDTVRAAAAYRKLLAMPKVEEGESSLAQLWLLAAGLTKDPRYPLLRSVDQHYTETAGNSALYLEEVAPRVDVWRTQIKPAVGTFLGAEQIYGKDQRGDLKLFEHLVTHPLGPMPPQRLQDLLMQGIKYYVTAAKWSAQDIARVCLEVKVDCTKLPATWPLVDEIQTLKVEYLNSDAERAPHLITRVASQLRRNGQVFDTAKMSTMFSGGGWAIYVMSPDGEIFADSHRVSRFHHSSFLAAADVAGAGELRVENGILKEISNKSGHYTPGVAQLAQTLSEFSARGVDLTTVEVKVGGKLASGKFEMKRWPNKARDFVDRFQNAADRNQFVTVWKQLGFVDDPFAGR